MAYEKRNGQANACRTQHASSSKFHRIREVSGNPGVRNPWVAHISNVVIYLLSADSAKAGSAQALLKARPVISVQVLNEVTQVCIRKLRMDWNDVEQLLALVRRFCRVVPLTEDMNHGQAIGSLTIRNPFRAA